MRNRSETVTVKTPRGEVSVVRQEMRGIKSSSWRLFWLAHRHGSGNWIEATTVREAILRATLLPPRKLPPWLNDVAVEAERKIAAADTVDAAPTGSSDSSDAPAADQ